MAPRSCSLLQGILAYIFFLTLSRYVPLVLAQNTDTHSVRTNPTEQFGTEPLSFSEREPVVAEPASIRKSNHRRLARSRISTDSSGTTEHSRAKRGGTVTFDANCNVPLPPGSNSYVRSIKTRKDLAQKAYDEAVKLAQEGANMAQNVIAYGHYFDSGSASQFKHFHALMNLIASGSSNFAIQFECSTTVPVCISNDPTSESLAVTDSTSGGQTDVKIIHLCAAFFKSTSTKFFTWDPDNNINSPPFRDNTNTGWCSNKLKPDQFETIGTTILHELTHLDTLGTQAGLTEGNDNTHGTGDLQGLPGMQNARNYLVQWKADKVNNLPPDENAESYAGAASEGFFTNRNVCPGLPVISPP